MLVYAGINGFRDSKGYGSRRCRGAFYPTAIGSEPILDCDSMMHWRRCMQGHAACNLVPVVAANRIGVETVKPCEENGDSQVHLNSMVLPLSLTTQVI